MEGFGVGTWRCRGCVGCGCGSGGGCGGSGEGDERCCCCCCCGMSWVCWVCEAFCRVCWWCGGGDGGFEWLMCALKRSCFVILVLLLLYCCEACLIRRKKEPKQDMKSNICTSQKRFFTGVSSESLKNVSPISHCLRPTNPPNSNFSHSTFNQTPRCETMSLAFMHVHRPFLSNCLLAQTRDGYSAELEAAHERSVSHSAPSRRP